MGINSIRNIAIIAHVDHGKTTLVDKLLLQSGFFRNNQAIPERVMDNNDLERERGITILAKNTSINYKGYKVNIVDTPGHVDFGGEVERIVNLVDGALLLVDAFEGPMPQTRFVLRKALEAGLKPIVVINKVDRPDARPEQVLDEILDLFIDLGADDQQLDFPVVYASAKNGLASLNLNEQAQDLQSLLEVIIESIPAPSGDSEGPLQLIISSIEYDNYIGRVAIGKLSRGRISKGQEAVLCNPTGKEKKVKITGLYLFDGLKRVETEEASAGEIVAIAGIEDICIGDSLCASEFIEALPFAEIDEPTISMNFIVSRRELNSSLLKD